MDTPERPNKVSFDTAYQASISIDSLDSCDAVPADLAEFAFIFRQIVAWGEMDALNHLNNVVYYRYAESARIAYLEALALFSESVQVVLAQSSCQYLRPVTFPDTLYIGVRCQHLGTTSMVMSYVYYSQSQRQVVATAESVLVRLDSASMQKVAWSDEQRQRIANFDTQPDDQSFDE